MPVPKKHTVRHIVEHVLGSPWQILPEKAREIADLLELRASGQELTELEIAARVGDNSEDREQPLRIVDGQAVIKIHGTIFQRANLLTRYSGGVSTEQLQQALLRAGNNEQVQKIVLDIDSPGGSAIGIQETVDIIDQVRRKKPVVASVNGIAASAAYWLASAADRIYASPSSSVGSIGTIIIHRENSRANDQAGIAFTVFSAGQFKADGNPFEPLTDQSRASLMERVVAYQNLFVESVAASRGVSQTMVRTQFGDGKMFIAREALSRDLIDQIATLEQVMNRSSSSESGAIRAEVSEMDKRLKAALYARGIIDSMDASDEVAEAACNAYFAARGIHRPNETSECLAAINNNYSIIEARGERLAQAWTAEEETECQQGGAQQRATQQQAAEGAPPAMSPHLQREREQEIAAAERFRICEIRSMAALAGDVPEATIEQAINDGIEADAFAGQLLRLRRDVEPIDTRIEPGTAQADRFNACALAALEQRSELEPSQEDMANLQGASLLRVATEAIGAYGLRVNPRATPQQIAEQFLRMGTDVGWQWMPSADAGTNYPAFQGSGSFPNVLSALANKLLDRGMMMAATTYRRYAAQLPDTSDYKPRTIVSIGEFNDLPQHILGDTFEHSSTNEGVSWIQVDSYGDEYVMRPDMIVNDDLDAFAQALRTKGEAHERTINKLVFNLLISDPRVADSLTMFDASHNNDIGSGSGGAPNSTQLSAMRRKHRQQVGLNAKNKLGYSPSLLLCGPVWETQAEQTVMLPIVPTQESDVNPFRGTLTPIIEPLFEDASNVNQWYTVVAPSLLRSIVFTFLTGYGRGGRRRSYFWEPTNCRHFQIEGNFGTAAVNHQGMVRNYGS